MELMTQTLVATSTLIASISPDIANATSTVSASATVAVKEASPWFSYIIDIFLVALFLFIWIFVKPEQPQEEELTEEEKPNPLEQVLRTDPVEDETKKEEEEKK